MSRFLPVLLLILYAGTGMTALAYEVLWTRMLSLIFGVSIFGVVFTVASFMAGLGGGSLLAARRRVSPRQALVWLGSLEGFVALYAVLMPWVMPVLDGGVVSVADGSRLAIWYALEGGAASFVLLVPATAMGMAFPFALRAAKPLRLGLGSMYGVNAIGGALGAIAPLLLLPWLGWQTSLWIVASIGVLLALSALVIARSLEGDSTDPEVAHTSSKPMLLDLAAYAGVGAAALILETVWTRLYGMVLLRTEYVLAVLLLVYLTGIGLGSVIARHMRGSIWFAVLPVVASMLAVAGIYGLPVLSRWANSTDFSSLATAMFSEGFMVALLTLPVTLALGAWLPLLARRSDAEHESGGWWYGANSLGAALGAVVAGFVLLPFLGATGSLALAASLLLVCGMRWVDDRRYWLVLPLLLIMAWPVRALPPVSDLLPTLQGSKDLSVYEDAIALTHVVEQQNGQRLLLSDLQRMDASTDPTAVTVQKNQARLPLLLSEAPGKVLFLGLGTGITASGALPFAGVEMTAVELSQGAITAARTLFKPANGGATGRMHILHDDARRFLRSDTGSYDVIVGDLFHPDMAGRANLLSLQQFQRVRERLGHQGIFVQWLALNQFDVPSLKVVLQTFRKAFGEGAVFIDGYRMALIGVRNGKLSAKAAIRHWNSLSDTEQHQAAGGEGLWTWMGRYWGEIPDFHAPIQDEWAPVIEYALPKVRYAGGVDVQKTWRWLLGWRASMDGAVARLSVPAADVEAFERAWAATGLDVRLWQAEVAGDERQAIYWARLSHRANPQDRWPGFALADRMFESLQHGLPKGLTEKMALQKILEIRPDHEGAISEMLRLAMVSGDSAQIRVWRDRLQKVSPLARILRKE